MSENKIETLGNSPNKTPLGLLADAQKELYLAQKTITELKQKVERLMHSLNDISERAEDLLKEDDFMKKLHIWSSSVIEFRKSLKDTEGE